MHKYDVKKQTSANSVMPGDIIPFIEHDHLFNEQAKVVGR